VIFFNLEYDDTFTHDEDWTVPGDIALTLPYFVSRALEG